MKGSPLISHLLAGIRRKRIWPALEELEAWEAEGRTLLLVTHDPAVAEQAEYTLHMRDGRLLP